MRPPKLAQERGNHDKYLPGFVRPMPTSNHARTIIGSTDDRPIPAMINMQLFALRPSVCQTPEQLNSQTHSAI